MKTRVAHCKITLAVAILKDFSKNVNLEKILQNLIDTQSIEAYKIFECENSVEVKDNFLSYIQESKVDLFDGTTNLFCSALDNGEFVRQIVENKIAYFEFDWRRKIFTKHISCDYLKFVSENSYLRINDMFALIGATDNKFNFPEFQNDYEQLWAIYTGKYTAAPSYEMAVKNWNRLCTSLEEYEGKRSPLLKIENFIKLQDTSKWYTYTYFLPTYTYQTVNKILAKFREFKIISADSSLVHYASDSCKVVVNCSVSLKNHLNKIFSEPRILLDYYDFQVEMSAADLLVKYNDLSVKEIDLGKDGNFSLSVLKELERGNFITSLIQPEYNNFSNISFKYSSPRIKKLLISAGAILEIYTFYQVLKTGYFDDVAVGYEFCWEDAEVKNELDLVLTKGFRSIFVECKAVAKLDLNYYHKLHSIAENFGIGTIKILVGNIYHQSNEKFQNTNDVNKLQRRRGSQLHVYTIWKQADIENIGAKLQEFMENGLI